MRRLNPVLVFFISLIPGFISAGVTGGLRGIVTEALTGEPCEGVAVAFLEYGQETGLSTYTDLSGRFIILEVPPGEYTVEFALPGYETLVVKDVWVKADEMINLPSVYLSSGEGSDTTSLYDTLPYSRFNNQGLGHIEQPTDYPPVSLPPPPRSYFSGRLYGETKRVMGNVGVKLVPLEAMDSFETKSYQDGNYQIVVPPGSYLVEVCQGDSSIKLLPVTLFEEQYLNLNIMIAPVTTFSQSNTPGTGSVVGRVGDLVDDIPLPEVKITVYQDAKSVMETTADSTGNYHIDALAPGNYVIRFAPNEFYSTAVIVHVLPDTLISMDVRVRNSSKDIIYIVDGINAHDPVADDPSKCLDDVVHSVFDMWKGIETAPELYVHPDFKDAPLSTRSTKDGLSADADAGYETPGNQFYGLGRLRYYDRHKRSVFRILDLSSRYKRRGNIRDSGKEIPNSGYENFDVDAFINIEQPVYPNWFWGYAFYTFSAGDSSILAPPAISLSGLEVNNQHNLNLSSHFRPWNSHKQDIELRFYWHRSNRNFNIISPINDGSEEFDLTNQTLFDAYYFTLRPEIQAGRGGAFRLDLRYGLTHASSQRDLFLTDSIGTSEIEAPSPFPDARRSTLEGMLQFVYPEYPIRIEYRGIDYNTGKKRYRYSPPSGLVAFLVGAGYKLVQTYVLDYPVENHDQTHGNWEGMVGIIIQPWTLSIPLYVERKCRAPWIIESYSQGPYLQTSNQGNSDLEPQKAVNISAGINQVISPEDLDRPLHIYWSVSGFYNRVADYIYQERTGETEYGLPVVTWRNVEDARFIGTEATLSIYPVKGFGVISNIVYQQADDMTEGVPLGQIPPLSGDVTLRYYNKIIDVNLWMDWAADQDRLGAYETETPGYKVFNASVEMNFFYWFEFPLEIGLTAKNILNTYYEDHLSWTKDYYGEPGRSIGISLSAGF